MRIVNLKQLCDTTTKPWSPRIVSELNGQHVKLALLHGEFIWHHHADADEMFLVVRGSLRMKVRHVDGQVEEYRLSEGEALVVPRGVDHLPIADEPCHVLLFEPAGTLNTGNVRSELTVDDPQRG